MPVPSEPTDPDKSVAPTPGTYFSRVEALQLRVNEAARALHERNVRPTVARIRAALGGGSPNDLAPALKHWRESVLPGLPAGDRIPVDSSATVSIPPMIADLAHELWQRATAAAAVEIKGGPTARQVVARAEEAQALRNQLNTLRDQLQRDALSYGELRSQSARHEAIAAAALAQVRDANKRERELLRDLGGANQRVAELEAQLEQLRTRGAVPRVTSLQRSAKRHDRGATKLSKERPPKRHSAAAKLKRPRLSPKRRPRPAARRGQKAPRR